MTQEPMDFRGVVRVRNDSTEIYGVWLGETFVWPDPWTDIWDEGSNVYWEDRWRNQWSLSESEIPLQEVTDGSQ